jgi:hypothetical protein
VKERPIIMSAEAVYAIFAGSKTVTRRVVKPQPDPGFPFFRFVPGTEKNAGLWLGYASAGSLAYTVRCPYGVPGDRLWVRETWGLADMFLRGECALDDFHADRTVAAYVGDVPGPYDVAELREHVVYRADNDREFHWRSSTNMPRWASRLTLEVTAVRVERLQEITTDDLAAEGFRGTIGYGPMWFENWREAWGRDNAKRGFGWESNPWVWVVGFKQVEAGE